MSKAEWTVTDYGMEIGDYGLEARTVAEVYDGMYGTIKHITDKRWRDHDVSQFVSTWRKAMVQHGYTIDEELFEQTIRRIARAAARSLVTGIFERLDNEEHRPDSLRRDGFNVISAAEMMEQDERVSPIVDRVLNGKPQNDRSDSGKQAKAKSPAITKSNFRTKAGQAAVDRLIAGKV